MPKCNSEQTTLIKRSILWLIVLLGVVGLTYYYEENLFKDGWESITTSSSPKEPAIYSVQTDKPQVALSFDVDRGDKDTKKILNILKKYKLHAAFFMTGNWIDNYPDDVKAMQKDGHDLGNHSENHKHMSQLSTAEIYNELNRVTEKVKKLTNTTMCLFRPPYGDYDNELIKQAKNCNYFTIQGNVDSLDWKDYGADSIANTVLNHKNLKNGSIILLHNGAKYTAEALPKIIEGLQKKGYEIVPISKLIYKKNYHMEDDGRQVKN